LIIIINNIKS